MIYLDYISTSPVDEEIMNTYQSLLAKYFANSDSLHDLGKEVRDLLMKSRLHISKLLDIQVEEVIFTSGASEANNMAIKGIAFQKGNRDKHFITTAIEHTSVKNTFQQLEELGYDVSYLSVDEKGVISMEELKQLIRKETVLVSIMQVNNEVGSVQPIAEIKEYVKKHTNAYLHVDMVQALGKLPVICKDIDLISFSAHKIFGLKGSGVLIKKAHVKLLPLISGGQQEFGYRGGTSNALVNIMFAKTLRKAITDQAANYEYVDTLRNYLHTELMGINSVVVNSTVEGSPFIVNFSCLSLGSEIMLNALNGKGFAVSARSTCSSLKNEDAYVLQAMNKSKEVMNGTIRIGLSKDTTIEELQAFISSLKEILTVYG